MPSDEPQRGPFPLPFLPSVCSYDCSPVAQGRSRRMGPCHPGHEARPAPCHGPWLSPLGKEANPAWRANMGWAGEGLHPPPAQSWPTHCLLCIPTPAAPSGPNPPDLPPCPRSLTCYMSTCELDRTEHPQAKPPQDPSFAGQTAPSGLYKSGWAKSSTGRSWGGRAGALSMSRCPRRERTAHCVPQAGVFVTEINWRSARAQSTIHTYMYTEKRD